LFNAFNSHERFCAILSKSLEFSTIFSNALFEFSKEIADLFIISLESCILFLFSFCQFSKFLVELDKSLKLSQSLSLILELKLFITFSMASINALELFSDISIAKFLNESSKLLFEIFICFNSERISSSLFSEFFILFLELNFFNSSLISIKKSVSFLESSITSFFSKKLKIKFAIKPKIEVKNAVFNQFNKVQILCSIFDVSKAINHNIIQMNVHNIQITVTRFLSFFVNAT